VSVGESQLDRRLRVFAQACRDHGLKVTHQRMAVFRALAASTAHPDAETVYRDVRRHVPSISRDTVYRTLATLERHGLAQRVDALTGSIRFDADTTAHHHFICTVCGAIIDFHSPALDALPIPDAVAAIGTVHSAQVQVRGVCAACAARQP